MRLSLTVPLILSLIWLTLTWLKTTISWTIICISKQWLPRPDQKPFQVFIKLIPLPLFQPFYPPLSFQWIQQLRCETKILLTDSKSVSIWKLLQVMRINASYMVYGGWEIILVIKNYIIQTRSWLENITRQLPSKCAKSPMQPYHTVSIFCITVRTDHVFSSGAYKLNLWERPFELNWGILVWCYIWRVTRRIYCWHFRQNIRYGSLSDQRKRFWDKTGKDKVDHTELFSIDLVRKSASKIWRSLVVGWFSLSS